MGSGIFSQDVVVTVDCECGHQWDVDLMTDDWGHVDADVECPECEEVIWVKREAL